jgi:D-glycero-beta-D-manno-heptose 1-phosphate adenylyltransferase
LGKVVSQEEILLQRREWNAWGKRAVFLVGGFDLLHPGHVRLLEQSRAYGDIVAVGVFSDDTVSILADTVDRHAKIPGPPVKRPIIPACERAEVLAALAAVDFAFEIDSRALTDFLRRFRPDAIVDGGEPSLAASPLATAASAAGIKVIHIPLEPGHSSTRLIERIAQLRA